MADECDIANDRAQAELENRIAEFQWQLGHAVSAYEPGRCRNCSDKIDDGRAFCTPECRDDFAYRQKADKRNGKYRGG